MEFQPDYSVQSHLYQMRPQAEQIMLRNQKLTEQMLQSLPKHRDYIERWLAQSQMK